MCKYIYCLKKPSNCIKYKVIWLTCKHLSKRLYKKFGTQFSSAFFTKPGNLRPINVECIKKYRSSHAIATKKETFHWNLSSKVNIYIMAWCILTLHSYMIFLCCVAALFQAAWHISSSSNQNNENPKINLQCKHSEHTEGKVRLIKHV